MERAFARAPVRVDPAGGGTDAPPFSVEHGGMVVNIGIGRHAFASVDRLPPGSGVIIYSEDLGVGVTAPTVDELPGRLEFLEAFVRRLADPADSLLLVTESDVPAGAGLGGSGAVGVAAAAALDRAYGREPSQAETAILANSVERDDLGYPGGDQDSFGAALGGINRLEYVKGGGTRPHRIAVPHDARRALEHRSLLIYTSEAHVSGNIHQDIKDSYALENSPTVAAMMRLGEEAAKMAAALASGNLDGYVDSLNASCRNLYRLHPNCDSEAHRRYFDDLDDVILGGKTCGAGGGGAMLVFTKPGRRRECLRRAERMGALVWPVTIDFDGVQTWTVPQSTDEEVERYRRLAAG